MTSHTGNYRELRDLINDKGLLEKQLGYYGFTILLTLGLLALSLTLLGIVDGWFQLLIAAFLAFVFVRVALLGHDFGHRAVFDSIEKNWAAGLVCGFLLGMIPSWWIEKHDEHHTNPNLPEKDPDYNIPVIAFTIEQALSKRGLYRWIVKYQSYLWYFLLCLEGFGLRLAGILYLRQVRGTKKYPATEPFLMGAHFAAYLFLLFWLLDPWWLAFPFIAVHQLLFGFWMSTLFAPNHKGMPTMKEDEETDFLMRQMLPTRNVKAWSCIEWWYGGLNWQSEHHLFPNMPRNKLKEARLIVKPYCLGHGIPYHETGVLESQWEVLRNLNEVALKLRKGTATA